LKGFYLVLGSNSGDEVQGGEEGQSAAADLDVIDDVVVEAAAIFVADVAEVSLL
jgi:hypothetical protein